MKKKIIILSFVMFLFLVKISFSFTGNAPILCYSFDNSETSGTTLSDLSASNNDGTITGDTTTGNTGLMGQAYYFDGTGDYVLSTNTLGSGVSGSSPRTFTGWVKMTTTGSNQYIWDYGNRVANYNQYGAYYHTASGLKLGALLYGTDVWTNVVPPTNTWFFLTISYDGTTVKVYKDNSLLASGNKVLSTVDTQFKLGNGDNGLGLIGYLDEVMVFDYELSSTQRADLYNSGAGYSCKDMFNITSSTAPTTTIDSPAASSWHNSDITVGFTDTDNSGTGLNECGYRIYDNGVQTLGNTTRTCSGTVTIDISQYCTTEGLDKCQITAYSRDNNGDTSPEVSRSFSIDTSNPTITTLSLDDQTIKTNDAITITSDGADAQSGINTCHAYVSTDTTYDIGDTDLGDLGSDCDGTVTVTNGQGSYYVIVRPVDNVGYSAEKYISLIVDNTAPTTTIDSPAASSWHNDNIGVYISDSDGLSGLGTCQYRLLDNGVQSLAWSSRGCNVKTDIVIASYCTTEGLDKCTIEVKATDASGNTNTVQSRSFSIDTSSPTITTVTLDKYTITPPDTITITSDGADTQSGIATCHAYLSADQTYDAGDTDLGDLGSDCDGTVTVDAAQGGYYVIVRPVDNVGYSNTAASTVLTVEGVSNFQITAVNEYDNTSLVSFSADISTIGTYSTTNGTINTPILQNETTLYNMTIYANNYLNTTVYNLSVADDYQALMHQAELRVYGYDILGNSIKTFNTTAGNAFNQTYDYFTILYLNSGNYTITAASPEYMNASKNIEILPQTNTTTNISFYKIINISGLSVFTSQDIYNFSLTAEGQNQTHSISGQTTNGTFIIYAANQTYNITVDAPNYALYSNSILYTPSQAYNEYKFNLYSSNSFNITFIDESTLNKINTTTIYLDLISDIYANNYSTSNGTIFVDLLTPTVYNFRYYASGYLPRLSTFTLLNRTYNEVTLYLLSGGSNVTLYVYDDSNNPVESATIKIYRYSAVSNSYNLVNTINTNFEGKAVTNLELNKEFYKFYIYYNNELKKSTTPAYITGTEIIFTITLDEAILSDFFTQQDYISTCGFNPRTNNFNYYYDTNLEASQGCLKVYRLTALNETLYNSSCVNSASSNIYITAENISGRTYIAKGYATINGQEKLLCTASHTYQDVSLGGNFGMLIVIFLLLLFVFIGSWNMSISLILFPLSLIFGSILGLINIPVSYSIGLEVIGIILAILSNKQ